MTGEPLRLRRARVTRMVTVSLLLSLGAAGLSGCYIVTPYAFPAYPRRPAPRRTCHHRLNHPARHGLEGLPRRLRRPERAQARRQRLAVSRLDPRRTARP